MNDLIRPALYDAWHDIVPVRRPAADALLAPADVVGPVCETGDTFAVDRDLPPLAEGDLVAFTAAGAYGAVMSSTYNSRLLVPEVLVAGDRFDVIRARPSYDDMLSLDTIPAWLSEGRRAGAETRCRMTDRSTEPDRPFSIRLRLARAALLWERVWPACWPALAVLGAFLVLALFDLLAAAAGPGPRRPAARLRRRFCRRLLRRHAAGIVIPDRFAARRRIEQASGLAASSAAGARRPAERAARPAGGAAVGGASPTHGGGDAPIADRPARRRARRARPLGIAGRAGDTAADRRDRCRRRLARSARARTDARLARRIAGCRRKPRHLGHARPNTPDCRRNFCGREPRRRSVSRPAARCWPRCMAATRCRVWRSTAKPAISTRSTSRTFGPRRP